MSQPSRLLVYLQQHKSVTRLEAANELGIMNLWCRITDIEKLGWVIGRETISVPTRDGHTHVTRYTLIAEPKPVFVSMSTADLAQLVDYTDTPEGKRAVAQIAKNLADDIDAQIVQELSK